MRLFYVLLLFLLACGKVGEKSPETSTSVDQLRAKYQEEVERSEGLKNSSTGWLVFSDCDSFLWDVGKYAASSMISGVNVRASEFPESGRFGRRPTADGQERCWTESLGDNGSPATWSRDMGIGLIAYAVLKQDLGILEDHASYGEENGWRMGEPLSDGRTIYTPAVVGLIYSSIYALGGDDSAQRHIPDVWPSGLDDYQAHIQMMKILVRSRIERGPRLLDISETMNNRIVEHYRREPESLFYSYLHALYNGGMAEVVDKCLAPSWSHPGYVRCSNQQRCELAEWLFSCSLVLSEYEDK